ncbi:DUF397 domain-containing protein [Actinokineospora sp. HUAS TT18]|uniref:DUF397 domain-containing protein n=1 Tax=Actinokineospora sp. HUAS TT18 TaxID=3447451 RepID=UPI003F526520
MVTNQITWRKSSRSQSGQTCVELSNTLRAVRDSKNVAGSPLAADGAALVRAVKLGRFDR